MIAEDRQSDQSLDAAYAPPLCFCVPYNGGASEPPIGAFSGFVSDAGYRW
jgi:hypothetical protein